FPTLWSELPARCRRHAGVNGSWVGNWLRIGFTFGAGTQLWSQVAAAAVWGLHRDLPRYSLTCAALHYLLWLARNWGCFFPECCCLPGVGTQQCCLPGGISTWLHQCYWRSPNASR